MTPALLWLVPLTRDKGGPSDLPVHVGGVSHRDGGAGALCEQRVQVEHTACGVQEALIRTCGGRGGAYRLATVVHAVCRGRGATQRTQVRDSARVPHHGPSSGQSVCRAANHHACAVDRGSQTECPTTQARQQANFARFPLPERGNIVIDAHRLPRRVDGRGVAAGAGSRLLQARDKAVAPKRWAEGARSVDRPHHAAVVVDGPGERADLTCVGQDCRRASRIPEHGAVYPAGKRIAEHLPRVVDAASGAVVAK